jgi:signal transduction histidine kinase
MLFPETLRRQPKWLVLAESLGLVVLTGWFDYATGWEWSLFAPFALPIILATWKLGWRWGFACAVFCTSAFWLAHVGNNPYHTAWGFGLAVFGRWFYFSVLVVAVATLKAKREIDQANIAALERAQELERETLAISDREKERLGRDLHDGLCQTLAGIAALSATLAKKLEASSGAAASAEAAEITGLLKEAIEEARNLAHGLGPVDFEKIGLDGALEALAVNVQYLFRVSCSLKSDRPCVKSSHEVEVHLFRIAQQAVNNALAHGNGRRIEISLTSENRQGLLCIRDDGEGFPAEAPLLDGNGIRSMTYRARLIGASLEVRRGARSGVEVRCAFPLSRSSGPCENPDSKTCPQS